jgi:hypothetical protein
MAKTNNASKKKAGGKKVGKRLATRGDPPIIVGGGGSAYIWILKSTKPQLVDPTDAPVPPHNAANYFCILTNAVIEGIEADDGIPGAGKHKVKPDGDGNGKVDPKLHKTTFS